MIRNSFFQSIKKLIKNKDMIMIFIISRNKEGVDLLIFGDSIVEIPIYNINNN